MIHDDLQEGHGDSSMPMSTSKQERAMSSDNRSKRASFSSAGGDVDRLKRIATEGCVSVSSGRSRELHDRGDMPSFDLGIDDVDEVVQQGCNRVADSPMFETPTTNVPVKCKVSPRSANKNFSELLIGGMLVIQDEKRAVCKGKVLFGDATTTPVPWKKLATGDFAANPFYTGYVHRKPSPESTLSLFIWVTGKYVKDLERAWLTHPYPHHIELAGKDIKCQLLGAEKMDPDMFAMIVRRFGQLDANMSTGNAELRWRHFLEPDFAAFSLAGNDVTQICRCKHQFIGDSVTYNLARTEMLIVPANLADGWVCYVLDMKRKSIHVLDAQNLREMTEERRSVHKILRVSFTGHCLLVWRSILMIGCCQRRRGHDLILFLAGKVSQRSNQAWWQLTWQGTMMASA